MVAKYPCCKHCLDEPVHDTLDGSPLFNSHPLPCEHEECAYTEIPVNIAEMGSEGVNS